MIQSNIRISQCDSLQKNFEGATRSGFIHLNLLQCFYFLNIHRIIRRKRARKSAHVYFLIFYFPTFHVGFVPTRTSIPTLSTIIKRKPPHTLYRKLSPSLLGERQVSQPLNHMVLTKLIQMKQIQYLTQYRLNSIFMRKIVEL